MTSAGIEFRKKLAAATTLNSSCFFTFIQGARCACDARRGAGSASNTTRSRSALLEGCAQRGNAVDLAADAGSASFCGGLTLSGASQARSPAPVRRASLGSARKSLRAATAIVPRLPARRAAMTKEVSAARRWPRAARNPRRRERGYGTRIGSSWPRGGERHGLEAAPLGKSSRPASFEQIFRHLPLETDRSAARELARGPVVRWRAHDEDVRLAARLTAPRPRGPVLPRGARRCAL